MSLRSRTSPLLPASLVLLATCGDASNHPTVTTTPGIPAWLAARQSEEKQTVAGPIKSGQVLELTEP